MNTSCDSVSRLLESHAVRISTRKRQKLALVSEPEETLYLVRSGLYLARVPISEARYQIVGILYPGDIIRALALPPLAGAEIVAASETGEVWRLRWSTVKALLEADADLARHVTDRFADQAARLALLNTIIANLTGEERIAALMTEMALRIGRETAAGITFEMPLSRTDIAEHLALNADTVSRIVSRLRASRIIGVTGRNRFVCPDFEALARECPLAATLRRLHGKNPMPLAAAL